MDELGGNASLAQLSKTASRAWKKLDAESRKVNSCFLSILRTVHLAWEVLLLISEDCLNQRKNLSFWLNSIWS